MTSYPPPDDPAGYSGPPAYPPAQPAVPAPPPGWDPNQQAGYAYGPAPQQQQPYGYGYGYPQPQYGYPLVQGPGQNGLGIAGMITGIAGLVLCWIPFFGGFVALVGVILSGVSLPQSRSRRQGSGFGIAGLVCGGIGLILAILYVIWFFYEISRSDVYTY